MTKIREAVNACGTPVSVHICETCGVEFTLCPVIPDNKADQWPDCLADGCPSYDPERDMDVVFKTDAELAEGPGVISMEKLRLRKRVQRDGIEILRGSGGGIISANPHPNTVPTND